MTERDPGAERDPDEGGSPRESELPRESEIPREDQVPRESAEPRESEASHESEVSRESGVPGEGEAPRGQRREPSLPADEEAAWAAIVAAYGEEPADEEPTDAQEKNTSAEPDGDTLTKPRQAPDEGRTDGSGEPPVRSFTVYAAGTGPRDWDAPEEDEGHFEPPEPPPLPQTDTTTKFAWVAVLGGPLLLLGAILFQADLTWWIVTLGVGGFLGGFATLVTRMRDGRDEDDWDDPGRGAVV